MAQDITRPNPKQIIEDLEEIDFILYKKIRYGKNGKEKEWTIASED